MHPAVVLLLGCATAAAQDSLAVCDLNTDLPESLGTVNLKFSESVMVHNNLGGKGGKDAHNDDDPHEIRRAARPSPRLYPRSTNLTPALRRNRRLSNIARLQVLDAAITAGMLPDAQVSCQAMWEAYGPIFFPGSKVRGTDSKFAFDWQQSCCPCAAANTTAVDPILGMTSEAWCTLAGYAVDGATSCAETMVTINQKHLYHVLNPTGATVDIGSDIVVTNRSEYDPKNPKANGIVLTNADDGSTGGLVQINVRTNTSVDMRMRTKPSCCLDLVSDGELSACEWWEAAPFDEAAFAALAQGVRPRTQGGDEVWLNAPAGSASRGGPTTRSSISSAPPTPRSPTCRTRWRPRCSSASTSSSTATRARGARSSTRSPTPWRSPRTGCSADGTRGGRGRRRAARCRCQRATASAAPTGTSAATTRRARPSPTS